MRPFKVGDVPCNGCTRCCTRGDAVRMLPGDNPGLYQLVPHTFMRGQLMLDHKPNGDCIYLGATGCTIHATRPKMCREMDCRNIYLGMSFTEARRTKGLNLDVWRRGQELYNLAYEAQKKVNKNNKRNKSNNDANNLVERLGNPNVRDKPPDQPEDQAKNDEKDKKVD